MLRETGKKKRTKYNTAHRLKDPHLKPLKITVEMFDGKIELQFDRATRRVPMTNAQAMKLVEDVTAKLENFGVTRNVDAAVIAEVGEVEEDDDLGEVL